MFYESFGLYFGDFLFQTLSNYPLTLGAVVVDFFLVRLLVKKFPYGGRAIVRSAVELGMIAVMAFMVSVLIRAWQYPYVLDGVKFFGRLFLFSYVSNFVFNAVVILTIDLVFYYRWSNRRAVAVEAEKQARANYQYQLLKSETNPHFLFNCLNVTLDLRTMDPKPHDPADMLTNVAGCDYDQDATYAGWAAFLRETFDGDDELAGYLQRLAGKALSADTSDERFTIACGPTRTGKSTTLDTILAMFGDYGATAQAETFQEVKRNSRAASGDVARLAGVRFLECPEPPKGMMLDVALIKQLTGGDTITARKLNQGEFQFRPAFHLVMNTNYLPEVRDQTLFESSRVIVVPFLNRRAEGKRDTGLKTRMREPGYLSGVLNWALDGLRMEEAFGDRIPDACRRATAKYSSDSDRIGAFIADECGIGEGLRCDGARIYDRYTAWAEDQGYTRLSRRKFYQDLERRDGIRNIGKSSVGGRTSRNVFTGIGLNDEARPL